MAKQVTIRRGTTAEHSSFAGAEGEITVDTTKDTVVVHDGETDGGFPLALESAIPTTGTIATQDSDAVAITGGSVIGITDLTIADGGTGASDASTARSNLGSTTVGDAVFVATDEEVARAAMLVPNKNVIINGNFDIWQRGTSGFGHNTFSADRWLEFTNTNDTLSISRQAFTTGQPDVPNEPEFFLRAVLTAGSTGAVNDFRQRVEGVRTFAGETVTLSYYAKASVGVTQVNRTIIQDFGTGGSPTLGHSLPNITLTTFWQKFTDTVTLTSISGKTVGTGGDNFLDVVLGLPLNTTTTVDIAQVQLEKGSVATEFERRSQQQELAMAQRYFEKSFKIETAPVQNVGVLSGEELFPQVVGASTGTFAKNIRFKTRKRRDPTVILYNPGAANAEIRNENGSADWSGTSSEGITEVGFSITGTTPAGSAVGNKNGIHYTADAEL